MRAFLIADIDITDPTTYEDYKRQVAPLIARFGGRYLARGGLHEVLEGDSEPHRLVVLERGGPGNLHRSDEWSFGLTAARMAAEQERRGAGDPAGTTRRLSRRRWPWLP